MSKPGPKRTKTEREIDLWRIERLDRRGYTTRRIALSIGVSQQQVVYDLKRIRHRYQKMTMAERAAQVAKLDAQLDEIIYEAWKAYKRSKKRAVKTVTETTADGVSKVTQTIEQRLPAAEYLRIILAALQARRELFGLDAPKQTMKKNCNFKPGILQEVLKAIKHPNGEGRT